MRERNRERAAKLRIGIVTSRFNEKVSDALRKACVEALKVRGVTEVLLLDVPGALEVPLALQRLAQSGRFDALIALGAVIRGETYHFEVVANESAAGIMTVQLDTGVPIANGILTTDTEEQAIARVAEKSEAVAGVAIKMANVLSSFDENRP